MNAMISSMVMRPLCFMCKFLFFFGILIPSNDGQQHAAWLWAIWQASIWCQGQKNLTHISVCCKYRWIKEVTPTYHWQSLEATCIQEQDRCTAWFQLHEQHKGLDDICHLPRVVAWLGPETQEQELQDLTLARQFFRSHSPRVYHEHLCREFQTKPYCTHLTQWSRDHLLLQGANFIHCAIDQYKTGTTPS